MFVRVNYEGNKKGKISGLFYCERYCFHTLRQRILEIWDKKIIILVKTNHIKDGIL